MPRRSAFTRSDLLATLAVTGAVSAIVIACAAHLREHRHLATSHANIRTIAAAHATYASDWNDRQLTFCADDISLYGNRLTAFRFYCELNGTHPAMELGWGNQHCDGRYRYTRLAYRVCSNCANGAFLVPIEFTGARCNPSLAHHGAFRLQNAGQFNQYLGGRFYDPVFYAPKDEVVIDAIAAGGCFDDPGSYCRCALISDESGDVPGFPSYCLSPAAMVNPTAFAHDDPDDEDFNGFEQPWHFSEGFESPSVSQALYPDLKTRVLEHHWLQNNPGLECNPGSSRGTYGEDGCEPYYFNHSFASAPLALFYDGHIAEVLVQDAVDADALIREQNNPDWGLWSQDTPWGADGYFSDESFDGAQTSFHVLTTDGILGRDILGGGKFRTRRPPPVAARTNRDKPRPYGHPLEHLWAVKASMTH